jgi:SAM-dependent methyltransferase
MDQTIEAHNKMPAAVWGSAGDAYDKISRQIASALDHCVSRIDPKPGEHILDLATGTGWTSRLLARSGANVIGVDLSDDLLAAARARAKAEGLNITYQVGDAERLPYPDASFDAVVSTFGVMFASNPEAAAKEMARVCRKGGRLGLTTWTPDGTVYQMFVVMKPYMPAPPNPAPPSPFAWGNPARVQELLGRYFDLKFEEGVTTYYDRGGEAAWTASSTGYGPTKSLAAGLDARRRSELQRDFSAFHDKYRTPLGIALPREYLLTLGMRL